MRKVKDITVGGQERIDRARREGTAVLDRPVLGDASNIEKRYVRPKESPSGLWEVPVATEGGNTMQDMETTPEEMTEAPPETQEPSTEPEPEAAEAEAEAPAEEGGGDG